jgi:protoporphyrinogen IX oxidase
VIIVRELDDMIGKGFWNFWDLPAEGMAPGRTGIPAALPLRGSRRKRHGVSAFCTNGDLSCRYWQLKLAFSLRRDKSRLYIWNCAGLPIGRQALRAARLGPACPEGWCGGAPYLFIHPATFATMYLYFKALHIIFIVTWFAGLFYVVRLFIYQTEALDRPEHERAVLFPQLSLMARRLWLGITWPSAVLTLVFGPGLLVLQPSWLELPFMHAKLTLVALLLGYHMYCHRLYGQLQRGVKTWSSDGLRLFNELATLFLVSIVFVIVLKNTLDWLAATLGLVIFALLLMVAIRVYKRIREK